jgi:small nuclear ribonucleoprotein (snRNP)-like protein
MVKNLLSILTICSIILISNNFAAAQTRGSWAGVQNLVNLEIAVKTRNGKTIYGVLKSADDSSLKLQIAEKKSVSRNETSLSRVEIEKIWRANLFINKRKTAKGALIGAGIGSAIMGVGAVAQGDDDGLAGVGFVLGAIPGALVGGTIGFFKKKKHEKGALVFET